MLHRMARRIGAKIVEVPGSHAGFITHSHEVADVIDEAARQTSASVAK
jgi:hypothetical protein